MSGELKCPRNLKWLRAMADLLPEKILLESKLAAYLECLKERENGKQG